MTERTLTYLAVPYSHPDPQVRMDRFIQANRAAGALMQAGEIVFSPISHTHPIAEQCSLPLGWDFWQAFDRAYIAASKKLVVLRLEGWRESVGVSAEIKIAREMGIPVEFIDGTMPKNWTVGCLGDGEKPTVADSELCGPCFFGEAATAGGNW